jgi:hypothetical protein
MMKRKIVEAVVVFFKLISYNLGGGRKKNHGETKPADLRLC